MASTSSSSLKATHQYLARPQRRVPATDTKAITHGVLMDGSEHVVSHRGTGLYNIDGAGTAACGLAALNFARVVFSIEKGGLRDAALLQAVLARECAEETTAICARLSGNLHLEVEDISRVPLFEKTLKLKTTSYGQPGVAQFKLLLMELNYLDSSAVAIITRPPEILACLKLRLTTKNVFIIFDSHPRPSYPNGAGMIVNSSAEGTARRLTELIPAVDLLEGSLPWQEQLLSNYSGHVFVPHGVEMSTPTLWQAVLESSISQLSMPSPNGLQPQPTRMNERERRVPGGDDDGEGPTASAIRERVVFPDQARSLSPTASGGIPSGPVGIESIAKTVLQRRFESPLVDRERVKSPATHEQRRPDVNGFNSAHDTKSGSAGNVTSELIRGLKARDAELETLRRREAWMKVALVQAAQAGFVYVNTSPGNKDLEFTDEQPKIAEEMRGAAAPNEADAEHEEDETKNGEAKSKIREAEVFAQEIEAQREEARRLEERARLSLEEAERLTTIGETAAQKKEVEATRKEAKAKKLEAEALVRETKAQTREAEVLLRETAVEQKEEEVSRREDEARRLEERARQALESIRQAEASAKMREAVVQRTAQQMEAKAARREGDLKKREAEVQRREAEVRRKDEEASKREKQAHFEKVRQFLQAEAYVEIHEVSINVEKAETQKLEERAQKMESQSREAEMEQMLRTIEEKTRAINLREGDLQHKLAASREQEEKLKLREAELQAMEAEMNDGHGTGRDADLFSLSSRISNNTLRLNDGDSLKSDEKWQDWGNYGNQG